MKLVTYTLDYDFSPVCALMSDEQATRMSGDPYGFTCNRMRVTNPHGESVHTWVKHNGKSINMPYEGTLCEITTQDAHIKANRLYVGDSEVYPAFGEYCYTVLYQMVVIDPYVYDTLFMTTVANSLEEALRESPSSNLSDYVEESPGRFVYTGLNASIPPELEDVKGEVIKVTIQRESFRRVQPHMNTFAIGSD